MCNTKFQVDCSWRPMTDAITITIFQQAIYKNVKSCEFRRLIIPNFLRKNHFKIFNNPTSRPFFAIRRAAKNY